MNGDNNMQERVTTTAKDFFLHLGATVTLYVAAGSLINLMISVINYLNPDQLAGYFYSNSIAWPISMLVVLVPILYVLEWLIGRDIKRVPEKANVWIRRWRIYLTLFLSIALIGGDIIALINTYLNGEITARFVYKIIAVLVVGLVIGVHYLFSITMQSSRSAAIRKITAYVGIVVVLAAVVTGFIVVGTPGKQRAIRFDNQRVNELSSIQSQVINYWQKKGELPESLDDLDDSLAYRKIPTDPETETAYGYQKTDKYSFELCADFSLATQDTKGRGSYLGYDYSVPRSVSYPYYPEGNDNWEHDAGYQCFERTIDPQLYPVQKDNGISELM